MEVNMLRGPSVPKLPLSKWIALLGHAIDFVSVLFHLAAQVRAGTITLESARAEVAKLTDDFFAIVAAVEAH